MGVISLGQGQGPKVRTPRMGRTCHAESVVAVPQATQKDTWKEAGRTPGPSTNLTLQHEGVGCVDVFLQKHVS